VEAPEPELIDVVGKIEMKIGRDAELIRPLILGAEANGKELVDVKEFRLQVGLYANGLIGEEQKGHHVLKKPVEHEVTVLKAPLEVAHRQVIVIELKYAIDAGEGMLICT
jgi:hypothetical protein